MIEISQMTLEDFEEIKDILQTEFDEFWKPSILKSELENTNSKYIVAKENNRSYIGVEINKQYFDIATSRI